MSRVANFIDGGYLYKVLRRYFREMPIDYSLLPDELAKGQEILRTYYYDCLPFQDNPPTTEQREFYSKRHQFVSALKYIPRFEVRLGKLVRREVHFVPDATIKNGYRLATPEEIDAGASNFVTKYEQKGIDVHLGTDLARLAAKGSISTAVIVAGDHDFVTPVRSAKDDGVLIRIYYRPGTISSELLELADDKIEITKDIVTRIKKS